MPKNSFACPRDCNNCLPKADIHLRRMIYRVLTAISFNPEFDTAIDPIVNGICPNLTCCPECGVDDFCHVEGCEFADSLVEELLEKPKRK